MDEMIGYCGINCTKCPAFEATQKNDDDARARVAQEWSQHFGADLKAEDINCEGCLTDTDRIFNYCRVCDIRSCAGERELVNCAYCGDYGCEKLTKIHDMVPDAKNKLEEIRQAL
jgi:hypothetical protein